MLNAGMTLRIVNKSHFTLPHLSLDDLTYIAGDTVPSRGSRHAWWRREDEGSPALPWLPAASAGITRLGMRVRRR